MDESDRRCRASEEAAAWWVRFRAGELARSEREEFVDWLRESALHVAEMLRIAKVNDSLEQFQGWIQINTEGEDDDNVVELPAPAKPMSRLIDQARSFRKHPWTGLVAASAAMALVAL